MEHVNVSNAIGVGNAIGVSWKVSQSSGTVGNAKAALPQG